LTDQEKGYNQPHHPPPRVQDPGECQIGYTIYFEQNRPFTLQEWGLIREAAINMFNRLKQIKGGDGTGRPIVDNDRIVFNGDGSKDEDHEPMCLERQGGGFQFCKTARKSYDRYVKAILCVANFFAPGVLKVTCDGDDEPDCWTEGVRIANIYVSKTGRFACSPLDLPPKAPEVAKSVYEGSYTEIDEAIELLAKIGKGNKVHSFLANYLKANIDDIKDGWPI
jgi:hypothetical protein